MKNSALAGTAQWGLMGQLPTFDLDLAPFLLPLLTFIYLFFPTTESIRNTVSLVAYHWVHIAFREAPPAPPPLYCQEPIPFGRLTACAKNQLGKFFSVVSMRDQKKKRGEAGKGLGNEMEKPTHGRLGERLFNLLRAYRPGHAALGSRGAASVPR